MVSKKRLKKGIASLEEQIKKHKKKIEGYESNNILVDYWKKEIQVLEQQRKKRMLKLNH